MPVHSSSARYLFFGIEHHGVYYHKLVPWIWTAVSMEMVAGIILVIPPIAKRIWFLNIACILANVGIWIEKGMGVVIPGFVPTPQGTVVEYNPSMTEVWVCLGIWAFGILIFSWLLHLALPIMTGKFRARGAPPQRARNRKAASALDDRARARRGCHPRRWRSPWGARP